MLIISAKSRINKFNVHFTTQDHIMMHKLHFPKLHTIKKYQHVNVLHEDVSMCTLTFWNLYVSNSMCLCLICGESVWLNQIWKIWHCFSTVYFYTVHCCCHNKMIPQLNPWSNPQNNRRGTETSAVSSEFLSCCDKVVWDIHPVK